MGWGWAAVLAIAATLCAAGAAACGSPAGLSCVTGLSMQCQALYSPTFDKVFSNTLSRRCDMANCHGVENPGNGLILHDHDQAYDLLVAKGRVMPGKPECSLLVERLESSDPSLVMPRGAPLTAGEKCAIEQWIWMGANK